MKTNKLIIFDIAYTQLLNVGMILLQTSYNFNKTNKTKIFDSF